ncbi:MAG: succinate-semialdehyde dehydrogenase/glutarate-semialdehyde dehydrogenase, partial [Oceanospirillaceae bacterium]
MTSQFTAGLTVDLATSVPTDLYINGQWVPAADGGTFSVINPANNQALTSVASACEQDVLSAIAAAHDAGHSWASFSPRARAEILRKAFELMIEYKDVIARLISLEEGKTHAEALGEVGYAAEF